MVYLRNEPIATDDLSVSQPKLLGNTNQADDSFGVDHYAFSNLTANNGFHNKVTTPDFVDNPPTGLPPVTTTNPIFYGFTQPQVGSTLPIGSIQFSKGPTANPANPKVPSPVTYLQSINTAITLASNASTNVLDVTGLTNLIALGFAKGTNANTLVATSACYYITWNGTNFTFVLLGNTNNNLFFRNSANIIQLADNSTTSGMTGVFWTLQLLRVQ